jgi:hypothetical protein
MPIEYLKKMVVFSGTVGVEEAETLLATLKDKPSIKADFLACQYLHPANIQVLLAAGTIVHAWPKNRSLALWLMTVFP